jgi:hypothetical protein
MRFFIHILEGGDSGGLPFHLLSSGEQCDVLRSLHPSDYDTTEYDWDDIVLTSKTTMDYLKAWHGIPETAKAILAATQGKRRIPPIPQTQQTHVYEATVTEDNPEHSSSSTPMLMGGPRPIEEANCDPAFADYLPFRDMPDEYIDQLSSRQRNFLAKVQRTLDSGLSPMDPFSGRTGDAKVAFLKRFQHLTSQADINSDPSEWGGLPTGATPELELAYNNMPTQQQYRFSQTAADILEEARLGLLRRRRERSHVPQLTPTATSNDTSTDPTIPPTRQTDEPPLLSKPKLGPPQKSSKHKKKKQRNPNILKNKPKVSGIAPSRPTFDNDWVAEQNILQLQRALDTSHDFRNRALQSFRLHASTFDLPLTRNVANFPPDVLQSMALSTGLGDDGEDNLQHTVERGVPAPTDDATVFPETFLLGALPPHVLQAMLDEHPTDPGDVPAIPIQILPDDNNTIASRPGTLLVLPDAFPTYNDEENQFCDLGDIPGFTLLNAPTTQAAHPSLHPE